MQRILFPKKAPMIETMENIYTGLANMGGARIRYAQSLVDYAKKLLIVIENAVPEFTDKFQEILKLYEELAKVHLVLAKVECRVSEDFRDPVERYKVLERFTQRYENEKDHYDLASAELIDSLARKLVEEKRSDYFKVQAQVEDKILHARANKRAARDVLKTSISDLIAQRKKYNNFKARRLAAAYTRYVNAVKPAMEQHAIINSKIAEVFNQMIVNGLPEEVAQVAQEAAPEQAPSFEPIVEQIESAAAQSQKEAESAPEPIPEPPQDTETTTIEESHEEQAEPEANS